MTSHSSQPHSQSLQEMAAAHLDHALATAAARPGLDIATQDKLARIQREPSFVFLNLEYSSSAYDLTIPDSTARLWKLSHIQMSWVTADKLADKLIAWVQTGQPQSLTLVRQQK